MIVTLLALVAYLAGLALLVFWKRQDERADDFIIGSRNLSWKQVGLSSFATLISSYNIVVAVTFAYLFGLYLFLAFAGVAAAYILLYFFSRHLRKYAQNEQLTTIADYFAFRFGPHVGAVANTAFLFVLFFFLVLQIHINTGVFAAILEVNKYVVGGIFALIVLGYVLLGGFRTVVRTDVLQGVLMLAVFILLLFADFSAVTAEGIGEMLTDRAILFGALALMVAQGLSLAAQPELWQRIYAARSMRDLRLGFMLSFGLLVFFLIPIVLVGLAARLSGAPDPSVIFFELVAGTPAWAAALVAVAVFAAFMSTLDSTLFAMASQLAKGFRPHSVEKALQVRRIRYFLVGILGAALIVSFAIGDFLSAVFQLIAIVTVVSTVWLAALLIRASREEVLVGLIVGITAFIYAAFFGVITQEFVTTLYPSLFTGGFMLLQRLSLMGMRTLRLPSS